MRRFDKQTILVAGCWLLVAGCWLLVAPADQAPAASGLTTKKGRMSLSQARPKGQAKNLPPNSASELCSPGWMLLMRRPRLQRSPRPSAILGRSRC
ncbi:hypothetical protein RSal33209_1743 [Renibacterium salmoninarum ATCC 33209]|uniref:Secreted protein n=1 Tax=Renibacterium salmoninarum (strain ATCC 33209 / DSM 20767 / JCM 11484 / NBRC 15589 / NCIMB 2235) TaxID=288705 RepID=A9WMY2_RENSM|nr:hypothetical protein RSal33209_1743 [Renibacterium salmoninarum ATCC 33209]